MRLTQPALAFIALFLSAQASPVPETGDIIESSILPRSTHTTTCVGAHDGVPGYWVCAEITWYSEYKADVYIKVHDGYKDGKGAAGKYYVNGKGVDKVSGVTENHSGYGKDVLSSTRTFDHPFGGNKRILSIAPYGCSQDGKGAALKSCKLGSSAKNPYVPS